MVPPPHAIRGLCEARGEYCAFLDGDDYWAPEFLNKTSAFLDAYPDAVAVSVLQYHKIIGKPPVITPHDTGITQAVMLENFYEFWAKYNHVCTGSVLMRTATAQSTGGQREDLRICEDLEFWALLATYGNGASFRGAFYQRWRSCHPGNWLAGEKSKPLGIGSSDRRMGKASCSPDKRRVTSGLSKSSWQNCP